MVAAFAYFSLFGFFSVYDDEGYNVALVRMVAQGVPLYTGQFAYHGPVPYLIKAFLLTAFGIPITHQSLRLWVMAVWLLSSGLLAAAVWRLTANWMATIGGLVVVGYHLFPLRFNPGHPEDFVVLFLSLAIFLASAAPPGRSEYLRIATLALIGAILVGTKINVGMLYCLAMGLWILAEFPRTKFGMTLRFLFIAGATGTPLLLMHGSLLPEWQLLAISTFSLALTSTAVLLPPIPPRYGMRHVLVWVGSVTLGLAGIALAAMLRGSRFEDIVEGAVLTAAKHPNIFLRPVSFGFFTIPILGLFTFMILRQCPWIVSGHWTKQPALSMLKVILALSALLLGALMQAQYYIPLIGPICWLIVLPDGRMPVAGSARSARLFLASMAAFQMLQVFPVKGTQTAWSTLALCICSLVLLYDGMLELSQRPAGLPKPIRLSLAMVAGLTFFLPLLLTMELWNSYSHTPSLGFGDSNLVRIPLGLRAKFDWIVASSARYCDVLITQPGMNSFLLWSKPLAENIQAGSVLITGWPLILTAEQESQTIVRLGQATNVCAIYNKQLSDWWTNDGPRLTESSLAQQPLVSYVRHLHPIQKIGDYEIRGNQAVLAKWTDDYLLNGIRTIDGSRDSVGIPADLLRSDDVELLFGFQARRAGPLLSIQRPGAESEEDTIAAEPLVYIAPDGALMIRQRPGSYLRSLLPPNVLDGLWHELSLQREGRGWQMSLDGVSSGRIPEFLGGPAPPRYLQLGPAFIAGCPALEQGWVPFFGRLRDVRVKTGTHLRTDSEL
jgi:preprotein translocase subunit Sss1